MYNVDASSLVTAEAAAIDLTALHAADEAARSSADDAFVLAALARFAAYVRAKRNEPTLTPLDVRADDIGYLTVVLGREREQVRNLLARLGLRVGTVVL